ncbi:MAG: hypothetical protein ACT4NV_01095 [Rhodoferax sp.]
MQKKFHWSLGLLATATLAACGGGGTASTTSPSAPGSSALSGVVIDGPIQGATVCLDLNNNLACDTGEPSDTTKAKGAYALDIAGLSAAQLRNAHLFVSVPSTAMDEDDAGKTLEQAGKAAFNLLAPANTYVTADGQAKATGAAIISPLTTLVSNEILSGTSTHAEAADATVKSRLGLQTADSLQANYVGGTDAASQNLQARARLIAAALGEIKKKIGADVPAASEREKLLGALGHLQTQKGKDLINFGMLGLAGGNAPTKAIQDLLATLALAPDSAALVSSANTTLSTSPVLDSSATEFAKTAQEGFYRVYCAQVMESQGNVCAKWHLYGVKASTPGSWQSAKYYYVPGSSTGFTPYTPGAPTGNDDDSHGTHYYLTQDKGWVADDPAYQRGSYTHDSSTGMAKVTNSATGDAYQVRMSAKDLGGKKIGDLGALDSLIKSSLTFLPQAVRDTALPPGAKYLTLATDYQQDEYHLYWEILNWNCAQTCTSSPVDSFEELFYLYGTPEEGKSTGGMLLGFNTGGSSNSEYYQGSFDAEGRTSAGGTLTLWKSWGNGTPARLSEKVRYSFELVRGQPVLLVAEPGSVRAARLANNALDSGNPIFALRDEGAKGTRLYGGLHTSAAARSKAAGHGQFNAAAMEAIIQAAASIGLPQSASTAKE